jgi:hypothetical protein
MMILLFSLYFSLVDGVDLCLFGIVSNGIILFFFSFLFMGLLRTYA